MVAMLCTLSFDKYIKIWKAMSYLDLEAISIGEYECQIIIKVGDRFALLQLGKNLQVQTIWV